jgi:hypothetical protein
VARNALPARWSRSSRFLATVDQGHGLFVTDVRTHLRVTIDRGATILGVSFSPSGNAIVWGRKQGNGSLVEGGTDLFRARLDGSRKTRLTRGGKNAYPIWGTRRIAFSRVRPSGDVHFPILELWTMRPGGDDAQRLTRTSHGPIEWSSDGRRVLTRRPTARLDGQRRRCRVGRHPSPRTRQVHPSARALT